MSEDVQIILIANIFRIMSLLVGFGFAYLGYKLYTKGVFDKTQDLKASFGNATLALKHVAPGVVFSIAGIIVGILAVIRPVMLDHSRESHRRGSGSTAQRSVNNNSLSGESLELSQSKNPKIQNEDEDIKEEPFASHAVKQPQNLKMRSGGEDKKEELVISHVVPVKSPLLEEASPVASDFANAVRQNSNAYMRAWIDWGKWANVKPSLETSRGEISISMVPIGINRVSTEIDQLQRSAMTCSSQPTVGNSVAATASNNRNVQ